MLVVMAVLVQALTLHGQLQLHLVQATLTLAVVAVEAVGVLLELAVLAAEETVVVEV
jgi:hypothetical protein